MEAPPVAAQQFHEAMISRPNASPRLRVLQCITRLGLGGSERVAFAIMDALRAEIDFAVFTVHGTSGDAVGAGLQRELEATQTPWFAGTAVPIKWGGMLTGAYALAQAIRKFRPDLVHFHTEIPESCGALLAQFYPPLAQIPVVRTIHNSIYWRYWPSIGRWCDRRLAHAYLACVSEAARDEFLRYRKDSGAVPPPTEPVIIYNGVAIQPRAPRPNPHCSERRRVLFAGRFEMQKGTDILCRALPLVRLPSGVSLGELTFMGHGAQAAQVSRLVANPPPGWAVTLCPPKANLATVYSQFDLVVMPSRFEGLGLIAIEASLCGLPVVTTDAPGLREALPTDYPWRAQPNDAESLAYSLSTALMQTDHWEEAVHKAQQLALTRFSPKTMGDGYQQLYSFALKGS